MSKLLLLLFFLLSFFSRAQPVIEWQKAYGGSYVEQGKDMVPTADGGYILIGEAGSSDGDLSSLRPHVTNVWVVKIDKSGTIQWQQTYGGIGGDYGVSIEQTTDGGYIFSANTSSSTGHVTGYHGNSDMWVVKLDASGAIVWQKALGGSGPELAGTVHQTFDGGYVVTGMTGSSDGDVSTLKGGNDAWVVKLSALGAISWEKTYGGTSYEFGMDIEQTSDTGYILTGKAKSADGDLTSNHGMYDIWVVKLNSTGAITWQKNYGGTKDDYSFDIQQTKDGGYVVANYLHSSDIDVTGFKGGNIDAWILKLNSIGAILWQKTLGGNKDDGAYKIEELDNGNFLVAGFTNTNNNGDVTGYHLNSSSPNYDDIWMVNLNNAGNIAWQKTLGTSNNDFAGGIVAENDSTFMVCGSTAASDFDGLNSGFHGPSTGGPLDIWLLRLGSPLSVKSVGSNRGRITYYPNPVKGVLTIELPQYDSNAKFALINTLGQRIDVIPLCQGDRVIIDMAGYTPGTYFLQMLQKDSRSCYQIQYAP